MKLATALNERANLKRHIEQLGERLKDNARVQEGDTPSEDPEELLAALDSDMAKLEDMIARINRTNTQTMHEGKSLSDLLARRDCLREYIAKLNSLIHTASSRVDRYSSKEIRVFSAVPVQALQKRVDTLSAELRCVDETIQELNWRTELL